MKNVTKNLLVTLILVNCVQAAMEGFIVGGAETKISKYPHSAFLNARCKTMGHWICGSAILNQRLLITAAHCVDGCDWKQNKSGRITAYVGNADLRQVSTKRAILDVKIHRCFNDQSMENDIALAMISRDFPLGPNVQRVVITKEFPGRVEQGYVAGWGIVREDELKISSMILKHVHQKVRSNETCSLIGHLHDGMFCAGSTENDSGHPAKGDSGSAFVTTLGYHQIGLVSFCIKRYPALMVYTNVSYYYDWVRVNSRNIYCENQ